MGHNLARKLPPKNSQPPKLQAKKQTFQEVAKRLSNEMAEEKRARIEAELSAKRKAEEDATYAMIYGPDWERRDDIPDRTSAPPHLRLVVAPEEERPQHEPEEPKVPNRRERRRKSR